MEAALQLPWPRFLPLEAQAPITACPGIPVAVPVATKVKMTTLKLI